MTVLREFNPTTGFWDAIFVGAQGPQGVPGPPGTVNGAYNVKDFGAIGDGVADDRVAIQTALNACRVAGGGTVVIPPGTYSVSQADHPADGSYKPCLIIGSKTRVQAHGATIKARTFAAAGWLTLNHDIGGGTDTDITIEGGTWDGSAASQTQRTYGVTVMRVTRFTLRDATIINCRGTAAAGADETFHVEAALSTDVRFEGCDVRGTAGSTASGFSANSTTGVRISDCRASGMTVGQGFTHNGCTDVVHVGCTSTGNGMYGFNSEVSNNVRYVACTATDNAQHGFVINETTLAALLACMANDNETGASWTANAQGQIDGGSYSNNSYSGISMAGPSRVVVSAQPVLTGNGSTNYSLPTGWVMASSRGSLPSPPIPATGVGLVNPYPFQCMVSVSGGTIALLRLHGADTFVLSGNFVLPVGEEITIFYSAAPTWMWFF